MELSYDDNVIVQRGGCMGLNLKCNIIYLLIYAEKESLTNEEYF